MPANRRCRRSPTCPAAASARTCRPPAARGRTPPAATAAFSTRRTAPPTRCTTCCAALRVAGSPAAGQPTARLPHRSRDDLAKQGRGQGRKRGCSLYRTIREGVDAAFEHEGIGLPKRCNAVAGRQPARDAIAGKRPALASADPSPPSPRLSRLGALTGRQFP